ncbi:EEF1A lysine methyltransferase 2 [Plecturocebus cupreus]
MEETQQPPPQPRLPLCDSLMIWVSARRRGAEGAEARSSGRPVLPGERGPPAQGSRRALPFAPRVVLVGEGATCGSPGRRTLTTIANTTPTLNQSGDVAGIIDVRHHTWLIFVFLVETEFHHVGQADLELLTSSDLPPQPPKVLEL